MEELRNRNKTESARRSATDNGRNCESSSTLRASDSSPFADSSLSNSTNSVEVLKKSEKLLRQRKNEKFLCQFKISGETVNIQASCQLNVMEVKANLLVEARKHLRSLVKEGKVGKEDVQSMLREPDGYVIKVVSIEEYIINESLPLQRVDFIQVCTKAFITPQLEMIPREDAKIPDEKERKDRIKNELKLGTEIATLVGSSQLSNFLQYENAEIADFRRCAVQLKREELKKKLERINQFGAGNYKDPRVRVLPEYLIGEPMPLIIPENVKIVGHFPGDMKGTVSARPVDTSNQLQEVLFNKFIRSLGEEKAGGKSAADYVLKVTGFEEYLYGDSQLISYDYIRRMISKGEQIEISLIPLEALEEQIKELSSTYTSIVDDLLVYEEKHQDCSTYEEIWSLPDKYKVVINSVERAIAGSDVADDTYLFILAELYHAGHKMSEAFTMAVPACSDPQWNETITFENVEFRNIALGCRIIFSLYLRKCDPTSAWLKQVDPKTDTPIAWVASQVLDHERVVKEGMWNFRMWRGKADPIGSCYQSLLQMNAPILFTEFVTPRGKTIWYPPIEPPPPNQNPIHMNEKTKAAIERVIRADPLTPLTDEDKMNLWGNRMYISQIPNALPKFLLSVNWDDCMQVKEAHKMLHIWVKPAPLQALELLDAKFADPTVRDFGVSCLEYMPDGECYDFMLQLTQVLKHEPYHNSALAMFLLARGWRNPKIGHSLVWFLKAEMHLEDVAERYTLLLESYLRGSGSHLKELCKQNEVSQALIQVALRVKEAQTSADRKRVLMEGLEQVRIPQAFQLPLDQRSVVSDLIVNKCKYMDSKKLPLWLVWKNAESIGKPILVIFKVGDDLRQDVLTLQVIRIFDKLWKNEGLDLLLQPYGCIATGDEIGMIEVVKNADTTANINKAAGGAKAVLRQDTLTKWLKSNHPKEKWPQVQETFLLSCAGYCVATFVLGIGDRHNDNIMVTRDGHLFHIDFGHFLGNYKKKYGFKRERAPFVFTPQYAHVLGGKSSETFQKFIEVCCRAFNILRRHSDMFITLFQMMLCTGIPELASEQDIEYLRYAFAVGMTDEEAAQHFKKLIFSSLNTKTTIINDVVHVWVHNK